MGIAEQTLLLIEHDEHVREALGSYLRDAGYRILLASTPREGLDLMADQSPDLVICDLDLAHREGLALVHELRAVSPLKPIIVISSDQDVGHVLDALRQGADDYLNKPIADLKMLEHAIERCLEQSKLRQQNLDYRHRLEKINRELESNLKSLKEDQQAGRTVQFRMLPETPKQYGDYHFSLRIVPSLYLSGDFVDYFTVGDHHVVFFIADVSGHGASSAFVTVLLKNFFARKRSDYRHWNNDLILSPAKLLERANFRLLQSGINKHVTLCVGVIDLRDNSLCYSVAGHLPLPLLVSERGCEFLSGEGMPIGLFEEAEFHQQTLQLPENFVLTLFSDGILEVLNADGLLEKEQFLKERLASGIHSIEDIVKALDLGHVKETPDDIAVLLISRQNR